MIFLTLFFEFAKIGLFTFGGGMATLPLLVELGERTGWYDSQFVTEMIAVAQSTPGPIGLNMATYVGYQVGSGTAAAAAATAGTGAASTSAAGFDQVMFGILGAVVASIGIALPCVIIASIVGKFLAKYSHNKTIQNMFMGIRPVVLGLILAAAWVIAKQVLFTNAATSTDVIGNVITSRDFIGNALFGDADITQIFNFTKIAFFAIIFAIAMIWKKHPGWLLLISAAAGILLGL